MGYKTYTSAQVYPLGREEEDQTETTKSAVLNAVLSGSNGDIAASLREANTNWSATKLRHFYSYVARNNPDRLLYGEIPEAVDIDAQAVADELTSVLGLGSDETVRITEAFVDLHDADYFADGWLEENRPGTPRASWESALDTSTNKLVIVIQDEEGLVEQIDLPIPADLTYSWENGRRLLYVYYNVVYQDPVSGEATVSNDKFFTYRIGYGGNAELDSLSSFDQFISGFYPVYFLRWFNQSLTDFPDDYAELNKAYRLLSGRSLDGLLEQIESNDNIDDIDFCYLFHGVNLGTTNQAGMGYLFKFFDDLRDYQTVSKAQHDAATLVTFTYSENQAHDRWVYVAENHQIHYPEFKGGLPSAPHPPYAGYPPVQQLIYTPVGDTGYSLQETKFRFGLKWAYIDKQFHSGNAANWPGTPAKEPLKKGEYWVTMGKERPVWLMQRTFTAEREGGGSRTQWQKVSVPVTYMFYQYDTFRFSLLEIPNLKHENYVYKDHTETTDAADCIGDPKSRFLVPLHEPTLQNFSLNQRATLANSASYLVFNAYEQVEVQWYQKGIFRFVLMAVALVFSGPAGFGLGSGSGVLGSNLVVGTALGLSGAAAAVAGAAANMVAAALITKLVTWGATEILGEEWGAIVGSILSFFALSATANYFETGSFSLDWTAMFQPENLLRLTDSVVSGYTHMLSIQSGEMYAEIDELNRKEQEEMDDIKELWEELMPDDTLFDPLLLRDATVDYGESRDTFLSRTLMTGNDIATLSTGYITDFTRVSLKLPDAIA